MSVAEVLDLLACPLCTSPFALTPAAHSVRCEQGHVFDLARQGYLNLLGNRPPKNADTAAMVGARDRFLARGHYRPIVDRVRSLVTDEREQTLLEVGAGPGYYLAGLLEHLPDSRGVALDVSVAAARRAARAHPRLGSVVADAWAGLPVASRSIDVLLDVFAPRNAVEFSRVLTESGVLVTVTPEPAHLTELRAPLGLLDIQPAKHEQLRASLGGVLDERTTETLSYQVRLDHEALHDLVAMGPNAFHLGAGQIRDLVLRVPAPTAVTVAVNLSVWTRRR